MSSIERFETAILGLSVAKHFVRTDEIGSELAARPAHPADTPRRHARHESVSRNVLSDDRARSNETIFPKRMPAHDRRVRADRRAAADICPTKFAFALDLGAGVIDVCEDTARPAEHAVGQVHAAIDADIVLNLAAVADAYVRPHYHVLAKHAVFADHRVRPHVTEMPNLGAGADAARLVNISAFVDEDLLRRGSHYDTWRQ